MKKKVVIICLGQPSTNPRTVKEAIALSSAGFDVTVIYNYCASWADETDKEIFSDARQIKWVLAGSHPDHRISYFLSRIVYKLNCLIAKRYFKTIKWQEKIESRFFSANTVVASKNAADIYIAHSLGALPVAAKAAQKNKALYAFDAEDYHRGQVKNGSDEWERAIALENRYLPGVAYFTAGSKLIAEQYKKHYPFLKPCVISNVFSKKFIQGETAPYLKGSVLKLFWMSQTIGHDRGIENILKAVGSLSNYKIQCTLLGNSSAETRRYLLDVGKQSGVEPTQIVFIDPVRLSEMFKIAGEHHIGMATEIGHNENNKIALSNKIFSYLLSGLAIVVSDTPAQLDFIQEHRAIGHSFARNNSSELAKVLEQFLNRPEELNICRENARQLAKATLNWEKESGKVVSIVTSKLSTKN
jgi:glycosyltransferase involved in cell wall biosynthesis